MVSDRGAPDVQPFVRGKTLNKDEESSEVGAGKKNKKKTL